MSPTISTEDLRLRYRNTTALDGVTLSLDGPGIYGLIGRNGSGKTSLMSVLAGFRRATGGAVRVNDQPVFENPRVTPQICLIRGGGDTVEYDFRSRVKDALRLAADLRPNWDADYAGELVRQFGISQRKRVGHLSTGQRSALASVLGLASRAPVTLLDETYLGMDAPTRYAFYDEVLRDFMAHPRMLVISSHLVDELSPLLERVVLIDQGQLLLNEDAETLRGRGAAVSGPADEVADFVSGRTVLNERRLGRSASVVVYGELTESERVRAKESGLDLEPVPLQDLFVHLTGGETR
ncbi:ABC-2 type transport system ATP-binding protein [Lipingzhangella halophila]|uniref:ABC-2 type transport system ATP-binding protein n=1 Tax=Lipingzhangella halophila TaxID=1783352 RepID=A0A7W7W5P0_9ACTN|nr:ABC transporter ATP-binding protein [Lipingzhangella halophila]MBB4934918.1 ABC-2 type transport system ATP-binding protein [Lipingzhangella halophila]